MSTKIFNFKSSIDFTDTTKIADGSLILQSDPGNDFDEDFENDTGFIYDSDKSEFSGGQNQQKDMRPANATFYASYTSDINGTWGSGTLTGTAIGGASVSAGQLDLAHNDVRYVDYDADLNADSQQTGCIRFKVTPNYVTWPATGMAFFVIGRQNGSLWNLIQLQHKSNGQLSLALYDQTGGVIYDSDLGTWSPTQGVEYEIEFNWDLTTGASRLFIDGTQHGSTVTDTGTRDSNIGLFRIGSSYNAGYSSNFYIDNFLIFSSVQHTSNYTPDWSEIYETIYIETEVVLPEMEYTGPGTLVEATNFVTSFGGSPRLTLEIGRSGNELYWDGAQWAVSNETYAQATDPATFATNVSELPVNEEIYGQFKIYYTNSDTQASFNNLLITLTSQIYPIDDPYIISNIELNTQGIENIVEVVSKSGNDDVSRVCIIDDSPYYFDGSNWVTSDYSYAQSNSAAEILSNLVSLNAIIDDGATFDMAYILHSDDGTTTPTITTDTVTYDFWAGPVTEPFQCLVYGYCYNENNDPIEDVEITITLNQEKILYNNEVTLFNLPGIEVTTDANGYWEAELIDTANMESGDIEAAKWQFTFVYEYDSTSTSRAFTKSVPAETTKNFADLPD